MGRAHWVKGAANAEIRRRTNSECRAPMLSQREPELTGVGSERGQGPGDHDPGFDFLPFVKGSQKKFLNKDIL